MTKSGVHSTSQERFHTQGGCGCLLAIILSGIFWFMLIMHLLSMWHCSIRTEGLTIPSRYHWFNGCQVRDSRLGWVDYTKLRAIGE